MEGQDRIQRSGVAELAQCKASDGIKIHRLNREQMMNTLNLIGRTKPVDPILQFLSS